MDLELPSILALARITACVGLRDEARLEQEIRFAIQENVSIVHIRETILQSYLFAGYASVINAFVVMNRLVPSDTATLTEQKGSIELWKERGIELCKKIYGSQYEPLVRNMNLLHPDLAEWMIWEGYGKVLARPFLSARVRELLIVAMTAVLNVSRQFLSHVRGAMNVGATPEELRSVFQECSRFADVEELRPVLENSILKK
jgi:4-carboxymuconolactone decarboxylase